MQRLAVLHLAINAWNFVSVYQFMRLWAACIVLIAMARMGHSGAASSVGMGFALYYMQAAAECGSWLKSLQKNCRAGFQNALRKHKTGGRKEKGLNMTNFIFCLIFIQVSVFLITGIMLLTSLFIDFRHGHKAFATEESDYASGFRTNPLTRTELEYFRNEESPWQ